MPQRLQPFLHDLVTALAAPTQVWSPADGNVVPPDPAAPAGLPGLLHADVRVLRGIELRVDGRAGEPIATRLDGPELRFTTLLRHVGVDLTATPDPAVRLDRTRRVEPGLLAETVVVASTLDQDCPVTVSLVLTPDATPVERIKDGRPPVGVVLPDDVARTGAWSAGDATLRLVAAGADLTRSPAGDALTATWATTVPARGRVTLTWHVVVGDEGGAVIAAPSAAPRDAGRVGPVADRRFAPWLDRSLADLDSLRMATPQAPDDVFYAAGAPWYLTLFGRDSLWAARLTLPLDLGPARGTLRTLARLQGTKTDPVTAEQPGKIPHELRRAEYRLGDMVLPPLYYGTIDATPLWVCLLHDAWRAGLADADVRELLPALEAALGWLTEHADADGDHLLEYVDASGHGLANQGWKDSADSNRFSDGRLATGAIALCEVQGYAYEAALAGAALLDAYARPGADALRVWAADLATAFRTAFWCGEGEDRFPAIALDGDKARVDTLTSNVGHLLGTGLLDRAEEEQVARLVSGPALDSGLGLRTLAATEVAYAPLSYHCGSVWPHDTAIVIHGLRRAGLAAYADGLVEGLLEASARFDGRLPELWSGEGHPVPYPASCRPQAWSAAAAVVVGQHLGAL